VGGTGSGFRGQVGAGFLRRMDSLVWRKKRAKEDRKARHVKDLKGGTRVKMDSIGGRGDVSQRC
jgi:hypothetical protein